MFEDCSIGGYWRDETPDEYCQRRRARDIRLRIRYGKLSCRVAVEDLLQNQSPISTLCVLDTWHEKACLDCYFMQVNAAVLCQQERVSAFTRRKHIPLGLFSSRGNNRRNCSVQATFILWTREAILRTVVQKKFRMPTRLCLDMHSIRIRTSDLTSYYGRGQSFSGQH